MYYQPESSETITMRDRISRQQVIQTDLELSETISDSDNDSLDSFDIRATVRELKEDDDEENNTLLLSEKSLNAGNQILGPVSFLSNTSLAEGVGRGVDLRDLEGDLSLRDTRDKQGGQTFVPPFKYPAVYDKQTGQRIGGLDTTDFSSSKLAGSEGVSHNRPNYYRNVLERGSSLGLSGGSVGRHRQKESRGVSGAPIGTDDPPFRFGRIANSRDDGFEGPIIDERETDPESNEATYRNSFRRLEALKRPAELGFSTEDSFHSQARTRLRGNGEESKKGSHGGLGERSLFKLQSPTGSTKVVPQIDQRNATSGLAELDVSVSSKVLSPRRDRFERPIKGSLHTEEECTTVYMDVVEQAKMISDRKSLALQHTMRADVLRKLNSRVTAIDLCCMEPESSKILHISTLDIIASKAIGQVQRWDKVKSCKMTAKELGINPSTLKEIVIKVITRSKVVEPILEIIYEPGVVAELDIQHHGVLSQLECPTRYPDELKWMPRDLLYEIADWYIQYSAILEEVVYLNAGVMELVHPMGDFVQRYPGPFPHESVDDYDNFKDSARAYRPSSTSFSTSRGAGSSGLSVLGRSSPTKQTEYREQVRGTPDRHKRSEAESVISTSTSRTTQREYEYEQGSGRSMSSAQPFTWDDAITYALSPEGPIARLSLPVKKMKGMLEECSISNCQFRAGLGNEQRIMAGFDKLAHKIKPTRVGDIINVGSWIRKLSMETENHFLPVWMRIQFLREHGGLCPGVDDKVKELVQTSFNMPESFLKDYNGKRFHPTHNKEDDKYWLCIWVEVLCWLLKRFYVEINSSLMMKEAERLMRTGIKITDDDNNYKALSVVNHQMNVVFEVMKQSSHGINNSPHMIYSLLILILQEKGHTGLLLSKALEREINSFLNNPELTLMNTTHGLTKKEMDDIKSEGSVSLTAKHFNIVLMSMLEKAQRGDSLFTIDKVSDLQKFLQKPTNSKKTKVKSGKQEDLEESNDDVMDEEESDDEEDATSPTPKKKAKPRAKVTTLNTVTSTTSLADMTKAMTIATDLPQPPPLTPWWVAGVNQRCVVCNGLHKDVATSGTSCLFYSSNGGAGGAPILRAKNMLNHDMVIFKHPMKWYVGPRFIAELKEHILPKLGIVERDDIDKIIQGLHFTARKMKEEGGSKSMNAQIDWGSSEKPPATSAKTSSSNGKSPARKETPKKTATTPAKSTPTPTKSALKATVPTKVVPVYHEEENYEDYEEEYTLDDEDM